MTAEREFNPNLSAAAQRPNWTALTLSLGLRGRLRPVTLLARGVQAERAPGKEGLHCSLLGLHLERRRKLRALSPSDGAVCLTQAQAALGGAGGCLEPEDLGQLALLLTVLHL